MEKIVIPCHDIVVSAKIPAKECQRLINSLPGDYSKTGQLMKSLTVVVGMIVVHTAYVDVEDGLINGATGVVKQIDFRMEGTNCPSIIWVLFDDLRVVKTTCEKYRKLYNSSINTDWTLVFDVQQTFIVNYKTYQRMQFQLTPASGKSVWKAEDATVDRIVVDSSQGKRVCKKPHIHYVALRRVKRLKDFLCIKLILAKSKLHSTMQDPCINILEMLNLNQMCWQQMSLDFLKRGCAEGMKMYTMLWKGSDL